MKLYVSIVDRIDRLIEYLLLALMVILVASVTLQVVERLPFFNFKTSMLEEFSRFAMVAVAYLSGTLLVRGKKWKLTCVDAIPEMLHGTAKKIIVEISQILSLAFLLVVLSACGRFVQLGTAQKAAGSGVPMWIIYLVIPISVVLMLLNWLAASFERWGLVKND